VAADSSSRPSRIPTGIPGLDEVLGGGLPPERVYLVEGYPGTGKTTLALQFLREGVRRGERVLYVALSESRDELEAIARSHGWTLDGIAIHEIAFSDEALDPEAQYTVFHPAEVELAQTLKGVLDEVARIAPTRLVFDSLSELRLVAREPLRYRRQILALKQFLAGRACTVLLLDDRTASAGDLQLQSISHGVIMLEQTAVAYGRTRRQLHVVKLRGVGFREGFHDIRIVTGGIVVYPALRPATADGEVELSQVASGVAGLDALVGGGLEHGTSVLIIGPAGTGKSTIATQYVVAAVARGEPAAMFLFDESANTLRARARSLGMEIDAPFRSGTLTADEIDPAQLTPGEFVHRVRKRVEAGVRLVVIDSLNGFIQSMLDVQFVVAHLHALLAFLNQRSVLTILVAAQRGVVGAVMQSPVDVTYLADTVVLLRHFEAAGRVLKAISVLKRRTGRHEETIRQLTLGPDVRVGPPLEQFQGVLTGVPVLTGALGATPANPPPRR